MPEILYSDRKTGKVSLWAHILQPFWSELPVAPLHGSMPEGLRHLSCYN